MLRSEQSSHQCYMSECQVLRAGGKSHLKSSMDVTLLGQHLPSSVVVKVVSSSGRARHVRAVERWNYTGQSYKQNCHDWCILVPSHRQASPASPASLQVGAAATPIVRQKSLTTWKQPAFSAAVLGENKSFKENDYDSRIFVDIVDFAKTI